MRDSLRNGFTAALPAAISVAAYGSVLGVLAAQRGLSWQELLLMNLLVFAGSSQLVVVEMWATPLPIFSAALATLIINLRYLLIGASLHSMFEGRSLVYKLLHIHLVADENWAVTMAAYRQGKAGPSFLLGGGLSVQLAWCSGTLLGHWLGAGIRNPEVYALDFAFLAVFTALAVSLWRGKRDLLPWLAAGVAAVLVERWVPGKWYVLAGGLSGAGVAALQVILDKGRNSMAEVVR